MYRHEISQQLWTTTMKFCLTWRVTESSQSPLSNAVYQAASKSVQNPNISQDVQLSCRVNCTWNLKSSKNCWSKSRSKAKARDAFSTLSSIYYNTSSLQNTPQPQKFARMLNSIPSWIVEWNVPRSLEDEFTIKEVPILHHSKNRNKETVQKNIPFCIMMYSQWIHPKFERVWNDLIINRP